MRRWAKRVAGALLVLVAVLSVPILWIEGVCTAPRDPAAPIRAPLVTDPGYARRASDSYLSFPEWHIVYAYEDLAGVLSGGDESNFAYGRQIMGFWRSLCGLSGVVSRRGDAAMDTRVRLYTIGWSFTAELGIKANVVYVYASRVLKDVQRRCAELEEELGDGSVADLP